MVSDKERTAFGCRTEDGRTGSSATLDAISGSGRPQHAGPQHVGSPSPRVSLSDQTRCAMTRNSGDSVVGGDDAVGAGLDAADPVDVEAVAVEEQAQLARRVAAGPQVDLDGLAGLVADLGALVGDARRGVERRRRRGTSRRSRR